MSWYKSPLEPQAERSMLIEKHRNKKEKCLVGCMITSFCRESRLNQAFQLNLTGIYFIRLLLYSHADSPNN